MKNNIMTWNSVERKMVFGKGWKDKTDLFGRLPDYAKNMVPADVWTLSQHSTGMSVRFKTNSNSIHARWALGIDQLALPHMPATSVSGLDLYSRTDGGNWRWVGVGRPETYPIVESCLNYGLPNIYREYLLYLPLHNIVTQLEIGVDSSADFEFIMPNNFHKPIVYYGTSIVHGIAASRAGICHASAISRNLNQPLINLGFSGRGKMELSLATLLEEIDSSLYILDCLPNMPPTVLEKHAAPFINHLATARPSTPILLLEDRSYANAWTVEALQSRNYESRRILRQVYETFKTARDNTIYYLEGDSLLGHDSEATVDGSHPNDIGFSRLAKIMTPIVTEILNNK